MATRRQFLTVCGTVPAVSVLLGGLGKVLPVLNTDVERALHEYGCDVSRRTLMEYLALSERTGGGYFEHLRFYQIGRDEFAVYGQTNRPIGSYHHDWVLATQAAKHPLRVGADLSFYERIIDQGEIVIDKRS